MNLHMSQPKNLSKRHVHIYLNNNSQAEFLPRSFSFGLVYFCKTKKNATHHKKLKVF